jgi:hypothetical protein
LAPVLRPEVVGDAAEVAGATLDVGDAVLNEAEAVARDVVLDLMTKPRLVNVWSMKPSGCPVEVFVPVGSVSRISKLGLMANSASSIWSFVPTVHV